MIDCEEYQLPFIQNKLKNYTLCKNGDVIFADASEDTKDICKPVEFINTSKSKVVSGLHTIHARDIKNLTVIGFKGYLFSSYNFHKQVHRLTQGTKIFSINPGNFKEMFVGIPSAGEQRDIVSLLSKIDKRIATQNKIIKDLRFLKKILMEHILNSFDFEELSLKDIIQQNYARIIKPSELKPFAGTKQYLSTSSIGEDGIEQIEQTITYDNRPSRASMLPIKNSIWFAKMKNSIKVYQSTGEDEHNYVLSTGFYGILCNDMKVNPIWIFETFKSAYFNNQKDRFSEGSSMSGIKDNQLSDIRIKLFLNKDDEKSCSEILSFLSKKIEIEIKLSEKYKEQKKFLLSNMFI